MNIERIKERLEALEGGRIGIYDDDELEEHVLLTGTVATNATVTDAHELIFEFHADGTALLSVPCRPRCPGDCSSAGIAELSADWEAVCERIEEIVARLETE